MGHCALYTVVYIFRNTKSRQTFVLWRWCMRIVSKIWWISVWRCICLVWVFVHPLPLSANFSYLRYSFHICKYISPPVASVDIAAFHIVPALLRISAWYKAIFRESCIRKIFMILKKKIWKVRKCWMLHNMSTCIMFRSNFFADYCCSHSHKCSYVCMYVSKCCFSCLNDFTRHKIEYTSH